MKSFLERVKDWDWAKIGVIAGLASLFFYIDCYLENKIYRIEDKIDEIPNNIEKHNMIKNVIVEELTKEENV